MSLSAEEAVDVANEVFGRHRGSRAFHAKGLLLRGTFTATPAAAALTRAAHMQGEPVPARARVSNAAGDPGQPDYVPDIRGLAVKFELPDGSATDIVSQTLPRFPFSRPEGFVDFVRAQSRPAAAWRMPVFLARYPSALPALVVNAPALRPPESYATCGYYAIHAYRFLDAHGGSRYVRYTWLPEAGDVRLGLKAARARGRNYLSEEIRERLERGPARFTLELQIAAPGDNADDPSARWPQERERVQAGTLELTSVDPDGEDPEQPVVFDPVRVTDGIELSGDPVLRFRPGAYAESVSRRTG
jgi:catalase